MYTRLHILHLRLPDRRGSVSHLAMVMLSLALAREEIILLSILLLEAKGSIILHRLRGRRLMVSVRPGSLALSLDTVNTDKEVGDCNIQRFSLVRCLFFVF
jgi:hypothetical protein